MLNIQLALYDLMIETLKESVERLRNEMVEQGIPLHKSDEPLDDTVPEYSDEIRALIITEARDLEGLLRKRKALQQLLDGLNKTEHFVSTELDNQVKDFAAESLPAEMDGGKTRMMYRTKK